MIFVFQGLHSASIPAILSLDICLKDTSKIVISDNDLFIVFQSLHSGSIPGILSLDICLKDTSKIVISDNDLLNVFQGLHSASIPGILSLDICLKDTSKTVTVVMIYFCIPGFTQCQYTQYLIPRYMSKRYL